MRVIVPPIKSQGIKTKLVPWIQALVPDVKGRWIEPFLGTGVVAFNSGFRRALLADINPHLIQFYQAIKDGVITPDSVRAFLETEGELLSNADYKGYAHFRAVKNRFNTRFAPLDFLFLSRAGFNGMMRFNRKGEWNIPFCQKPDRFARAYITKIVNQVREAACLIKSEWTFKISSFEELSGKHRKTQSRNPGQARANDAFGRKRTLPLSTTGRIERWPSGNSTDDQL